MLGSTCGALARVSRVVAFGLKPTNIRTTGFMFGESESRVLSSWHWVGQAVKPTFIQFLSGQQGQERFNP